eukprot:254336-Chlamydomonas_euryale.AAC.2
MPAASAVADGDKPDAANADATAAARRASDVRRLLSPFHGLRPFSDALAGGGEAAVAAAYDELARRHVAGERVTTPMLNAVLRALSGAAAVDAAVEAAGRLFEEYGRAGAAHDADAYNAVIAACVRAGKAAAVEGLVAVMEAGGPPADGQLAGPPPPNEDSWDALMRAHAAAKDADGVLLALRRATAAGVSRTYALT